MFPGEIRIDTLGTSWNCGGKSTFFHGILSGALLSPKLDVSLLMIFGCFPGIGTSQVSQFQISWFSWWILSLGSSKSIVFSNECVVSCGHFFWCFLKGSNGSFLDLHRHHWTINPIFSSFSSPPFFLYLFQSYPSPQSCDVTPQPGSASVGAPAPRRTWRSSRRRSWGTRSAVASCWRSGRIRRGGSRSPASATLGTWGRVGPKVQVKHIKLVGGLALESLEVYFGHYIGNFIIPTDLYHIF